MKEEGTDNMQVDAIKVYPAALWEIWDSDRMQKLTVWQSFTLANVWRSHTNITGIHKKKLKRSKNS